MLSFPFNSSTPVLQLQQGRVQEGRPRPRTSRRRPGPKLALAAAKLKASGVEPAPSPPAGRPGPSSRASRPGTTCCSRPRTTASAALDAGWRSTARCTCATSRTWPTWPRGAVRLPRPQQRGRRAVLLRRMRDGDRVVGDLRAASRRTPSSTSASRRCPTTPTCRARRRTPIIGGASAVGDGRQDGRRIQGRRRSSSTTCPSPKSRPTSHQRTGYLPITMAAFELTEKSGFYKKNPGTDVAGQADDPQDHRQVARHAPRQLRADPRHHRRGARSRSGPARRPPRRRSTTPSSAATSSSSASRRPTRADAVDACRPHGAADAAAPSRPPRLAVGSR